MSVRLFIFIVFLIPVTLFAAEMDQEVNAEGSNAVQDPDLFEFLAMFDQKDTIYLDSEMDEIKKNVQPDVKNPKVTKSESNEK